MSASTFIVSIALSLGYPGDAAHRPAPAPVKTMPNFILPGPFVPYLYPVVPSAVVIAHPNWYPYPGPAWWYTNNVTPYHPVRHKSPSPKPGADSKPKEKGR
jgi:hypothetical protein